ncbi:hypothetical protein BAUCODRAFT_37304 [Baudoinia panamericana UAMH 10762]|uniref:Origin recognition complex subunit 4 n=1 Tax=Baudoinia panamericana (strain UAMH 10762) TaxID=717646 RepID=M2N4I0_BAUPA|nr:uncharacterized protein BAUCODRAFT_37304 [Baudoinia panamericana UAMH 10762]EMC93620.1 hypothetical protein BAUCODRAFT_37304 [Baudoinia panamericana UAMH 10762]
MEIERAAKRRRLDNTPEAAPSKGKALVTYKSRTPGFQRVTGAQQKVIDLSEKLSDAQIAWAEAKSKSRHGLLQSRKGEHTVYDDVDDALKSTPKETVTGQKPVSTAKAAEAAEAAKAVSTANTKAKLDPLRNQKADGVSSPVARTPTKSAASVGFFKQFAAKRHAPSPSLQFTEPGVPETDRHDTPLDSPGTGYSAIVNDDPQDMEQRSAQPSDVRSSGRIRRTPKRYEVAAEPSSRSVTPSTLRKSKTLENEIKELAASAEKDAANEARRETRSEALLEQALDHPYRKQEPEPEVRDASKSQRKEAVRNIPKTVRRTTVKKSDHADSEVAVEADHVEGVVDTASSVRRREQQQQSHDPVDEEVSRDAIVPKVSVPANRTLMAAELVDIQLIILEKLTGKRPIPLTNLSDEYVKVSALVTQTVTAGESNSMLVIGARGSGKSALVNQIVREQAAEHPEDFHVVRLNGFIHTDDKIALREIWRQLGREMDTDEDESGVKNYADTLTTLLALLSHPGEQGREQPNQITKSVIFILDEFELFASHPRQTLLYNLFDIAQSKKAPIAVLGLTTKIDVSESLEKRVKSRFSHRYVHLGLAKSLTAYQEVCKAALSLQPSDAAEDGIPKDASNVMKTWNALVTNLFASEPFVNHLRRSFYTTKSVPDFMSSMLVLLATLPVGDDMDIATLFEHITSPNTFAMSAPDSKLTLLPSLSTLQLALLICAARLTVIYNTDLVTFPLAYEEYKVLASKAKLQATASGSLASGAGARVSGTNVARDAWDVLIKRGLVMSDGRSGNAGRVDVGLEEIGWSGVDLGQWGRWCREI